MTWLDEKSVRRAILVKLSLWGIVSVAAGGSD
jgi:hypothetical protein